MIYILSRTGNLWFFASRKCWMNVVAEFVFEVDFNLKILSICGFFFLVANENHFIVEIIEKERGKYANKHKIVSRPTINFKDFEPTHTLRHICVCVLL